MSIELDPCCCVDDPCANICADAIPDSIQAEMTGNSGIPLDFSPGPRPAQVRSNGACESLYNLTLTRQANLAPSATRLCRLYYTYPSELTGTHCIETWEWDGAAWIENVGSRHRLQLDAELEIWKDVDGHWYGRWSSSEWGHSTANHDFGTSPPNCCAPWTTTPSTTRINDQATGIVTLTPAC